MYTTASSCSARKVDDDVVLLCKSKRSVEMAGLCVRMWLRGELFISSNYTVITRKSVRVLKDGLTISYG